VKRSDVETSDIEELKVWRESRFVIFSEVNEDSLARSVIDDALRLDVLVVL
jgi:hypothetical protein